MKKNYFFLTLVLAAAVPWTAHAQLLGVSPDTIDNGINNFLNNHAWHWVAVTFRGLGNFFYNIFCIVEQWLSSLLVWIPDMTNPANWNALGQGTTVFQDITNVANVMKWLGFTLLVVSTSIYLMKIGSNLTREDFSILTFISFFLPLPVLFGWSGIVSWSARVVSDFGMYLLHLDSFKTKGVLQGLSNMNVVLDSNTGADNYSGSYRANFVYDVSSAKDIIIGVAIFVLFIAFIMGILRIKKGNPSGWTFLLTSAGCLMLLILLPNLFINYANGPAGQIGDHAWFPSNPNGQFTLPNEHSATVVQDVSGGSSNQGNNLDPNQNNDSPKDYHPEDTWGNIGGSIVRFIVSLIGIAVCFGVMLAKIYAICCIFILYLLGPVFIGLWGNPSWRQNTLNALGVWIQLHIKAVFWALGLFTLNHIVHLKMAPNGYGTGIGNILSAIVIIGGLWVIQNPEQFAKLFSQYHWGGAGTASDFIRTASRVLQGAAALATLGTSAPIQKLVAGAAEGTLGSALGKIPKIGGGLRNFTANAAGNSVKALNTVARKVKGESFHKAAGIDHGNWNNFGRGASSGGGAAGQGSGRGFTSGGQRVDFTKGGWPTSKGYQAINKRLGTNFKDTPLNSPRQYAERDAAWRASITSKMPNAPKEWIEPKEYDPKGAHANFSENRWKDIMDNFEKET